MHAENILTGASPLLHIWYIAGAYCLILSRIEEQLSKGRQHAKSPF